MNKDLSKIVMVMKEKYGRDISIYNEDFLMKAMERRWIAAKVNNAADYGSNIENNKNEADAFYNSLHITFSHFFRDPITYAILEQSVLPNIIAHKPEGSEIRIWCAGCSSGQEAYSMAMLLFDLAEATGKEIRFRIFATDISNESLAVGRAGVYDENSVQDLKLKQLNKYFTKQDKTYTCIPQLSQYINFSTYDLLDLSTANPPESIYGDFDIVSCCNLLIYYKADLHQLIIKKLQQALSAVGYLVTGESEKTIVENATKLQMISTPTAIFKNIKRRAI